MRFFRPNVQRLESRRDVPRLIAVLSDRDADVRRQAAAALGQIGDAAAVLPLIAALNDEVASVGVAAAAALARLGAASIGALSGLIATSDQAHYFARHRALAAVSQIGGESALEILKTRILDGDELTSQRVVEALLAFAGEVPPSVLALAVRHGGRVARRLAAARLRESIGPQELDLLGPALHDSEPDTQVSTALFFLGHGDPRGFEALLQVIENPPRDNGGNLGSHACARETLVSHMNAQPDAVPLPLLQRLADLEDIHKDVTYYLEDDPLYDTGHDTVTQEYADVRAAARQALQRQASAGRNPI